MTLRPPPEQCGGCRHFRTLPDRAAIRAGVCPRFRWGCAAPGNRSWIPRRVRDGGVCPKREPGDAPDDGEQVDNAE